MYFKATYTVKFKITDQDLYDEFESNDGTLVRFLSALLETVRYGEDWNKRVMETYSDEIWWDDDNDYGIVEVEVTFDTYGLPESSHDYILESMNEYRDEDFPEKFVELKAKDITTLFADKTEHSFGPLAAIVWWNSMIPTEDNEEGSFLEYEDSAEYEEFFGRIINFEDHTVQLISAEFYNGEDTIELEGSWDGPTTPEKLQEQINEYFPNFK